MELVSANLPVHNNENIIDRMCTEYPWEYL